MAKKQKIEYLEIGVDVYLTAVCKAAFEEFCPADPSLNCLRRNFYEKIDVKCREAVLKRLIDRNKVNNRFIVTLLAHKLMNLLKFRIFDWIKFYGVHVIKTYPNYVTQ